MNTEPTKVYEVQNVGYIVESLSIPGAWRLVTGNTCSCPAGHQQTCRHRRAVRVHQQAAERQRARPTVPPAIGMLCD